jgi:hypothetical protein
VFENGLFRNVSFDDSNTLPAVLDLCGILEPGVADMRTVTDENGNNVFKKHKKAWPFR